MRNQIFAIINTRKINSTLKYKLRYTFNNVKVNTLEMAASSAVWFSCVSCIPVVVTTLRAFSGKLPDFFISCCDCWQWHCSRQRPTRIGHLGVGQPGTILQNRYLLLLSVNSNDTTKIIHRPAAMDTCS